MFDLNPSAIEAIGNIFITYNIVEISIKFNNNRLVMNYFLSVIHCRCQSSSLAFVYYTSAVSTSIPKRVPS